MSPPDERHMVDISSGIVLTDEERNSYHVAIDGLIASKKVSDLEQEQIALAKKAVEDLHAARLGLPFLALIPEIGVFAAPLEALLESIFGKLSKPSE